MVKCRDCGHAVDISSVRHSLGHENREIVNVLERRRLSLDEFCYCEKLGFIESRIMNRDCPEHSQAD